MEIKWIGHSSFLIKNSFGKKILIDPIQIHPYIQKYDLKPDIITFSHSHNNEFINEYIYNNYKIINSATHFENDHFIIEGFQSYKDDFSGFKRGDNIIYLYEIDGFKLCHLGSLGHLLDRNLIDKLSNLDFLFIPIGGHFCLDGYLASKIATTLKPRYIIPMCFKTSSEYFYLDGPLKFLSSLKNIISYDTNTLYTDDLPTNNNSTVILLKENNKEPLV
ncbi:MBL fold metallo-hydrolase [Clostridium sp. AL.422]|uniref:MBL fold metallo-hydrolase n=1 Tax=Clostridium TaxID=1485 RepID=UPI00293DCA42|nr:MULTISPECIES: MBL fold metallo-hydrolase [unclassified Clostridium]MDV4152259.1 MBL fold metallo-hydrolase [Clostridium sp. AL.422]